MNGLSAPDRERLLKVLGLLSSDHAGERDAAALAAMRFLHERNITWSDVLAAPWSDGTAFAVFADNLHEEVRRENARRNADQRRRTGWRETVAHCLEKWGSLKPWELKFLRALLDLPSAGRLPPKDRRALSEIADRVLGTERAA